MLSVAINDEDLEGERERERERDDQRCNGKELIPMFLGFFSSGEPQN